MPSTTRHTLNRQRQRQNQTQRAEQTTTEAPVTAVVAEPARKTRPRPEPRTTDKAARSTTPVLAALVLLTLLLGGFAGWAHARAHALTGTAAAQNTALTDAARTSDVKGRAEKAVNALFSYDYANPKTAEKAAATLLTGKAVEQHRTLLAPVLAQAQQQKTVVTTTVTDSAVERIDGDRARVLVYADQSSTSTAAKAKDAAANYAGAMLAVDLVQRDGHWLVSAIDTFSS
ncbi:MULTISPECIES: hypothetical protein [unclassified Streptomyces]|uniref:hypothetical protein n=1 Tax=unclassified Streptomyces TaxID=2593676 RepID=UPI000DBAAD0E|nr:MULTISPECIES: hypothetical protein [unclassified Streptomyces]MYT70862.1 hypothetical protein [Streptomyces sp. SID8367]RAJ90568.1 Mce-associated membrane protein [Streptomyces sp. PsTaAH-137]